jgi:hypothetical protein
VQRYVLALKQSQKEYRKGPHKCECEHEVAELFVGARGKDACERERELSQQIGYSLRTEIRQQDRHLCERSDGDE